jgi:hypothetical protein
MAIVATESGALVPCLGGPHEGASIKALSTIQTDAIVKRFESLSPYNRSIVSGSVLKIEKENFDENTGARGQLYCYTISAKRYALFNEEQDGGIKIRKFSEHGLGHLLNPTDPDDESKDWIDQLWKFIVLEARGRVAVYPYWLSRPAISRVSATSPTVVQRLTPRKKRVPYYSERFKPMNFVAQAHV